MRCKHTPPWPCGTRSSSRHRSRLRVLPPFISKTAIRIQLPMIWTRILASNSCCTAGSAHRTGTARSFGSPVERDHTMHLVWGAIEQSSRCETFPPPDQAWPGRAPLIRRRAAWRASLPCFAAAEPCFRAEGFAVTASQGLGGGSVLPHRVPGPLDSPEWTGFPPSHVQVGRSRCPTSQSGTLSMPVEALRLVTGPSRATAVAGMPPSTDASLHVPNSGRADDPFMISAITPPTRSAAASTSRSLTCA